MRKNRIQHSRLQLEIISRKKLDFVNPGFQNQNRARSYLLTQPYIIDKTPFHNKILEILEDIRKDEINIFIPGIGNGSFINYLIQNQNILSCKSINIVSADISNEMITSFFLNNGDLLQKYSNISIKIKIYSGANLVSKNDPFYSLFEKEFDQYDIVLSSQFEHYFPNSNQSDLFNVLNDKISNIFLKFEFRNYMKNFIAKNGYYITIDDFKFYDERENESNTIGWDKYVLKNFTDPQVINNIRAIDSKVAKKIEELYNKSFSEKELLQKIQSRRAFRRQVCLEEIESFDDSIKIFSAIYGIENTNLFYHPIPDLQNFRMIIGKNAC